MPDPQQLYADPQRVIHRLTGLLAQAQLEAAKNGAMVDQLLEERGRDQASGDGV